MRITKAILEDTNRKLREDNNSLYLEIKAKNMNIEMLEKFIRNHLHSHNAMTIALEKISDAAAHVIADLRRG